MYQHLRVGRVFIKIIEAINLSYAYDLVNPVFKDINFEIHEGEFWGVLGKNGAGKTSLIEILVGFRWTDTGDLKIFEQSVRNSSQEYLENVSFLSHDVQIAGGQKIQDFFNFHSFFYKNYSIEIEKELVEYFGIDPDKEVRILSTGQQKKIQIIAALSSNTKLIIIDEITAVLDPETRSRLFVKLQDHARKMKKTIVLATNLLEDLEVYADKFLYVSNSTTSVCNLNEIQNLMRTI